MNLIDFLKNNVNTRKVFGKAELKIIEKQLLGINLTQSEKNRLSRDIRKKFDFIRELSRHEFDLDIKKGSMINELVKATLEKIIRSKYSNRINKIFLFGSTADNTRSLGSDVDVAVEFDSIQSKELFQFKMDISRDLNEMLDLQVYNLLPEKIVKEINKKGKLIYERKNN